MWKTTRKLVRQLTEQNKTQFETINEKYENVLAELNVANVTIAKEFDLLSLLVQRQDDFSAKMQQSVERISNKIEAIDVALGEFSDKSASEYDDLKNATERIITLDEKLKLECDSIKKEILTHVKDTDVSLDDIKNTVYAQIDQQVLSVRDELTISQKSIEKKIESVYTVAADDSNSKKIDSIAVSIDNLHKDNFQLINNIREHDEAMKAEYEGVKNEILSQENSVSVGLANMQHDNRQLREDIYEYEKFIENNASAVNLSVQELINNISRLDDASRLIIAKLLLNEMEI